MVKITDTTRTQQTSKANKAKANKKAGDVDFSAMVDAAQQTDATEGQESLNRDGSGNDAYAALLAAQEKVPSDPQERGAYLLESLRELEKNILNGNPAAALSKLKQALEAGEVDKSQLSPELQEVLDEIDLRAQIEVAKLAK